MSVGMTNLKGGMDTSFDDPILFALAVKACSEDIGCKRKSSKHTFIHKYNLPLIPV